MRAVSAKHNDFSQRFCTKPTKAVSIYESSALQPQVKTEIDPLLEYTPYLEQLIHFGHALEVLSADLEVLCHRLFREVEHVRGEEGDAVLLEVLLVSLEHAIEPPQKTVGAVVSV